MTMIIDKPKGWRDFTANIDILLRNEQRQMLDLIESLLTVPKNGDLEEWLQSARDEGIIGIDEQACLLTAIRRVKKVL